MKIPFEDGIIVDTDKLSDKDADIHEAIHNLYNVCRKYGVTAFTRVILNKKKYVGMTTVTKQKDSSFDFDFLMEAINKFVMEISNGKIALMVLSDDTPSEGNPPSEKKSK